MKKPWDNQKETNKSRMATTNDIIVQAQSIQNKRTRALFVLLYLTGARICELVRYSRIDKFDSVKRKDFASRVSGDRKVMVINIRNEKNKVKKFKDIPVTLDQPENIILVKMLNEYLETLNLEDELFPFNYQRAYKLLKGYYNPHWIRHIRLTHLTVNYDLNEQMLKRIAGWTDTRPAGHYIDLKWEDLIHKL